MALPTNAQIDQLEAPGAQQLLKLVNRAIAEVMLKGISYMGDGHQVTRNDLQKLYEIRDRLQVEVAAEASAEAGTFGGILRPRFPNDA